MTDCTQPQTTTESATNRIDLDDGWCEETGMSYAMMDILDDALRMFLPWPFHEPIDQAAAVAPKGADHVE